MTAGLASVALALHQDGVASGRRQQSQLIEGEDLTACLQDAFTGSFGHTQSTDAQLGDVQETQVVGHSSDNDGNAVVLGLTYLEQAQDSLQRDDGAVDPAHEQASQDDLVELLVRTAVQEAVQLKVDERHGCQKTGKKYLLMSNEKFCVEVM